MLTAISHAGSFLNNPNPTQIIGLDTKGFYYRLQKLLSVVVFLDFNCFDLDTWLNTIIIFR